MPHFGGAWFKLDNAQIKNTFLNYCNDKLKKNKHKDHSPLMKKHFFKFLRNKCGPMPFVQLKFTFFSISRWLTNDFLPILKREESWIEQIPGRRSLI